jgi:hypothetical protein
VRYEWAVEGGLAVRASFAVLAPFAAIARKKIQAGEDVDVALGLARVLPVVNMALAGLEVNIPIEEVGSALIRSPPARRVLTPKGISSNGSILGLLRVASVLVFQRAPRSAVLDFR